MTEQELIQAAIDVRVRAYAPYSKFKVGAAILTKSGELFVGCNVENGSYGLSICAERQAIGAMVASGFSKIETIIVAASPLASPCGACRQSIVEFGSEIQVVSVNANDLGEIRRWQIRDLIPDHFDFRK